MAFDKKIVVPSMSAYKTARAWAKAVESEFGIEVTVLSKKATIEKGWYSNGMEALVLYEGEVEGGDGLANLAEVALHRYLDSPDYWMENQYTYAVALYRKFRR